LARGWTPPILAGRIFEFAEFFRMNLAAGAKLGARRFRERQRMHLAILSGRVTYRTGSSIA